MSGAGAGPGQRCGAAAQVPGRSSSGGDSNRAACQACQPLDVEVWRFIRQVLDGLAHLAAAGIAWKDVKPSNILFVQHHPCNLKLAVLWDFGSNVVVGADGLEAAADPSGTAAFMAPELKYGRRVGPACDVWGMGCLLRFGVQLQLPDEEPDDAAAGWDPAAVLRGLEGRLQPGDWLFAAACLTYDDTRRPSAERLQVVEYLQKVPEELKAAVMEGSVLA
ncbi:kinase-like domain-containing protein [Scenedesmus sp. NREL 46B-D3]|nr:kinase-like domain-containing protein [Scenedesmus sp. NREL 46B-D3]